MVVGHHSYITGGNSEWKHLGNPDVLDASREFMLRNTQQDGKLVFSPHYKQYKERYGIYWNIVKPNSPEFKHYLLKTADQEEIFKITVDSIPIGNDQHEFEHEIKGEQTQAGIYDGKRYRYIQQASSGEVKYPKPCKD